MTYCHRCHGDGDLPKCPTCGASSGLPDDMAMDPPLTDAEWEPFHDAATGRVPSKRSEWRDPLDWPFLLWCWLTRRWTP